MIRKNASEMDILDERILEHLRESSPSSPSIMAVSKGIKGSEDEIHERCLKFSRIGLISQVDEDIFEITEAGESYLDGDLSLTSPLVETYKLPRSIVDQLIDIIYIDHEIE